MAKVFADAYPRFLAEWDRKKSRKQTASGAEPTEKISYTARLILVLGGKAVFRAGSAQLPAGPGTLLYLPPSCVYSSSFRGYGFSSNNIFFSFSDEWLEAAELKSILPKNVPFWGKRESDGFSATLVSSIGKGQDGIRVRIAKGPSAHDMDTAPVTLTSAPSVSEADRADSEPGSGSDEGGKEDGGGGILETMTLDGSNYVDWDIGRKMTGKVYMSVDMYLEDANLREASLYSIEKPAGGQICHYRWGWLVAADGTVELWNPDGSKRIALPIGEWVKLEFYGDIDGDHTILFLNGSPAFENDEGMHWIEDRETAHDPGASCGYLDRVRFELRGSGVASTVRFKNFTVANYRDRHLIAEPPAFSDAPELSAPFSVETDGEMKALIREVLRESRTPGPLTSALLSANLTEILVRMLRRKRGELAQTGSAAYQRIAEYVEEHAEDRLTGEALRDALNYHPYYMNRVISRRDGITLHEYILRVKLRRSKQLLAQTDLSVAQIAQALSFCDASHFSRVFAAHEGMSPTLFRSLISGEEEGDVP